RGNQLFELTATERALVVDAASRQLQGELGRVERRQENLRLLRDVAQVLQEFRIALCEVELQLRGDDAHDRTVEIVATKVSVAIRREDLEDAIADRQDRAVKGPAAEVVDGDGALLALVEPVGQRRGGRFVDDT